MADNRRSFLKKVSFAAAALGMTTAGIKIGQPKEVPKELSRPESECDGEYGNVVGLYFCDGTRMNEDHLVKMFGPKNKW